MARWSSRTPPTPVRCRAACCGVQRTEKSAETRWACFSIDASLRRISSRQRPAGEHRMSYSAHYLRNAVAGAGLLAVSLAGIPAVAQTLIEEWNSAKLPPPPELKSATLV